MFASFKIAAIALSAAAVTLGAGAAGAREFQSNGRSMEVYHGDLDLAQPDQQAKLRGRIARAADRVCASNDLAAYRACRSIAIAHVQPRMKAAIARAETKERYADASAAPAAQPRAIVGN